MRKSILTMLVALLALFGPGTTAAHAERVSEAEALAKAQQFMNVKFKPGTKQLRTKSLGTTAQKNIYIFNAESAGGGFVVVSGDDRTPAILGYAERGELDEANLPCNVRWLLDSYDRAIGSLSDSYQRRASSSRTAVSPLLDTQWGQGDPYNSLCPQISGEQCVTGCVATAMAQIINYNRWPQEATTSVAAYTSKSNSISMPALPSTTFDWNNMSSTAIARLMLYCGQSVTMDYGTSGSGASVYNVASALTGVFGYSKSVSYKDQADFSDSEWDEMLYSEIAAGRAVLFGGQSTSGGHAFVVDGYADGKYHINWGWNGYCDGYFTLDDLDPTNSGGFNSEQEMVCNIAAPAGAADVSRPKAIVTKMTTSSSYLERASASSDFASLTIGSTLQSDMSETATIQVGLALYNDNGLVKVLSSGSHEFTTTESYTYEASVTIGSDIAQGEYRIVAVNRSSDSDEWLTDGGSSDEYISVTVGETGLTLVVTSKSGSSSTIDFGMHTIDGVTYQLEYNGDYSNKYRATVMPLNGTEKYVGDVTVPNKVSYQNIEFLVLNYNQDANYDYPFEDCPELTSLSLSTSYAPPITNCPKLAKVEYCKGVSRATMIQNCGLLEELTYPETCSYVIVPGNCRSIKSLTFNYKRELDLVVFGENYLSANRMPLLTDIYFASSTPPILSSKVPTANPNVKIHIPLGTLNAYKNSDWKEWTFVEDQPEVVANTVNWDYCGDNESEEVPFTRSRLFYEGENNTEFAMRMPAEDMALYKGNKISAIEFYANASNGALPEYVFITTSGKDYLVKQATGTVYDGWTRIELEEPFTVTGEELFVGIGRKAGLFIYPASNDYVEDGLWLRYMGDDTSYSNLGTWIKNAGYDYCFPIKLRAAIEGDNLPTDVLMPSATITEDSKQAKVRLINRSKKKISSIVLNWDLDGKKQGQQTVETVLAINGDIYAYVDVPTITSGRNHTMTISVATLDGVADAVPSNSTATVKFSIEANTFFPRKIVMEEATGTWCGWCPRGIVGIEKLNEKYPDNFIAIAVHDDAMIPASDSYLAFFKQNSSYPNSYINRTEWEDPQSFAYEDDKIQEMLLDGVASITAQASFVEGEEKIKVNTESQFGFDDDGSTEYRIAYVLLEDNVGPYNQSNAYSDPTAADDPSDDMNWWVHQSSPVSTIYNEVARKIYDDYYGVEGSLPTVIKEGETYKSEYTLTLPDNVQNIKNLKIVTLLLDTSTGEILNADRTSISGEPYVRSYYPRKIVMEEGTATWCGYCPRGIVAIDSMKTTYPDNFIPIAIHRSDKMSPADDCYNAYFSMVDGYPTSYINRTKWMDPSSILYYDMDGKIDKANASIKIDASFDETNPSTVNVKAESVFNSSNDAAEYRIAYVLTEDNVGPYDQSNYYSDPTAADDPSKMMNWWIHQGSSVSTIYNDVARKIYDDYYGVEGSLPTAIKEGETYKSSYTMTLPSNVQDAKNLKVVALLLDTSTGEILNADRTSISGTPPTAIQTVVADADEAFDVYNLMGVKVRTNAKSLNGLPSGVYVVGGKKVIVK